MWWFGNGWNAQLGTGAGMVFLGSVLYTLVTSRTSAPLKPKVPSPPKRQGKKLRREGAVWIDHR